jgi:hypothetical protein
MTSKVGARSHPPSFPFPERLVPVFRLKDGLSLRQKRRGRFRQAFFEPLETRHLLSATATNPLLFSSSVISQNTAGAAVSGANSPLTAIANTPLTTSGGVQQMPSVAVDPHDANHVVVAYMDYSLVHTGYAGIGVAVSHDAGSTWQYSSVPLPANFDQGAANPIVKFDDQGHVFVTYMAATFLGDEKPPITSPDGQRCEAFFCFKTGVFSILSI